MKTNAILDHWEEILLPLLPDAEVLGEELVACNPRREDAHPGSFRLNLRTGAWADFALEDVKGRSPVSFIAYVRNVTRDQARHWAERRVRELGLNGARVADPPPVEEQASEAIIPVPQAAGNPPLPDRFGYPVREWCAFRPWRTLDPVMADTIGA